MATTITVSSTQALYAALANAKGGEIIKLAGGNYGDFALEAKSGFDITFPSNVTITSADPLHPASFSGLYMRGVENLTLDSVVFDYKFTAGDPIYQRPFDVIGGDHITIRNSTFDGDAAKGVSTEADGFGYGIGLSVRGASNVTIDSNEFYNFHRGLVVNDSDAVVVTGNDLHSMRTDGMDFSEVHGARIEGNHLHDFKGSPTSLDHPDMIQFWTNGTKEPSTDITIRGNVLDIGEGSATHSIFMRNDQVDRGLAGSEMFYRNVVIEENVITNGHLHGITVGETAGLTIRNNSVLHADGGNADGADASVEIPRINVATASTAVVVTSNITAAISGWTGQTGWTVNQNAFVQDQTPDTPGYYGDVFVGSSLTAHGGQHDFLALPGGMIDRLGAGATTTRSFVPEPGTVDALFNILEDKGGSVQTRIFDAGLSVTDLGKLPAGTVFDWSFGDGTTAQGQKVVHDFAHGGHYDVKLTVRLPNGVSDTTLSHVGVQDSAILTLGSDGLFRAHEYENTLLLPKGATASAAGIQLNNTGVAATVARTHVADILHAEDFNISMRLDADSKTSTGEVFRLHGSLIAAVGTKGEFVLRAFTTEGKEVKLTSTGVALNDLKSHDVDIRLDDGKLQLWVDHKLSAETAFSGTLGTYGNLDMSFGNQWGQKNFYGDITAFDISVGEPTHQVSSAWAWETGAL